MNCLLEDWVREKTVSKCKQISFMVQLIFGGLNINNKQCATFTSMYLACHLADFEQKNSLFDSVAD